MEFESIKMETNAEEGNEASEVKEDSEKELYDMASTPQIQSERFVGCVKVEVDEDDNYKEHTSDNLLLENIKEEGNDDILLEDTDEVRPLPDTSLVDPQDEQEMEVFNTQEDSEITIEEMKLEVQKWEMKSEEDEGVETHHLVDPVEFFEPAFVDVQSLEVERSNEEEEEESHHLVDPVACFKPPFEDIPPSEVQSSNEEQEVLFKYIIDPVEDVKPAIAVIQSLEVQRSYEDEVEAHHFHQDQDVTSTIADKSSLKVQAPTRTYQRAASSYKRPSPWGIAEIEKARKVEDIAQQCLIKDELLNPAKATSEEESMIKLFSIKPNITVFVDSANNDKLNVYDRRHKCLFCKKRYIGMATHLVKEHSYLKEVSCITKLKSKSLPRRQHLIRLTRIGDFQHNVQALMRGSSELIVLRQSESFVGRCNCKHFLPCPDCAGFLHKSHLRRHHRLCVIKGVKFHNKKRKLFQESRALLMNLFIPMDVISINSYKENVLAKLTSSFGIVAKSDCLIARVGQHLYCSDKSKRALRYPTTANACTSFVRTAMQKMGGLLLSCRRLYGNQKLMFHQLLLPERLPFLMKTVRTLLSSRSEALERMEMYTILYYQIITAVFLWRGKCLFDLTSPCTKADKVMQFYYRFVEVWENEMNSLLDPENVSNQEKAMFHQNSAFTSDVIILKGRLKNKMVKLTNELDIVKSNSTDCLWYDLAETTIVLLCLFNPVDFSTIENIKIAEYAVRPDWSVDSLKDYENKMSSITYHLAAKRIVVCTTIEHSGEEVVILLTPEIKKAIDVLIKKRELASVPLGNPYVFARQYSNQSTIKAVNCIYNLCIKSGPLTKDILQKDGRKRQYVSYISQISDMSPNEMSLVRDYLCSSHVDKSKTDSNPFVDVFWIYEITQVFEESERNYTN